MEEMKVCRELNNIAGQSGLGWKVFERYSQCSPVGLR